MSNEKEDISALENMGMHAELVTPEKAREYLKHNTHNRKAQAARVNTIARDIINDKWTLSPTPISFAADGTLLDGQHRLMAIIRANKPIYLFVARNVPNGTIFDRGKSRSAKDALDIFGYDVSNTAIALINFKAKLENHSGLVHLTDQEILDYYTAHQNPIDTAVRIASLGSKKVIMRKAVLTYAIYCALECGVPEPTCESFCRIVNTGFTDESWQSSAIVVRNFILDKHFSNNVRKLDRKACHIVEQGLFDFCNHKSRRSVYDGEKSFYSDIVSKRYPFFANEEESK